MTSDQAPTMKISEAMKFVRAIMETHLDPKATRYIGSGWNIVMAHDMEHHGNITVEPKILHTFPAGTARDHITGEALFGLRIDITITICGQWPDVKDRIELATKYATIASQIEVSLGDKQLVAEGE